MAVEAGAAQCRHHRPRHDGVRVHPQRRIDWDLGQARVTTGPPTRSRSTAVPPGRGCTVARSAPRHCSELHAISPFDVFVADDRVDRDGGRNIPERSRGGNDWGDGLGSYRALGNRMEITGSTSPHPLQLEPGRMYSRSSGFSTSLLPLEYSSAPGGHAERFQLLHSSMDALEPLSR